MADYVPGTDPTADELNRQLLESDESLGWPSENNDSWYQSTKSEHVTLTTGRDPGTQGVSGLEGISDLLTGIATGVVTVTKNVTEQKPPQPMAQPPKTEQPPQPTAQQPPSVIVVSGGAPVAPSSSKAPVIVASVVGGVAVVGVIAYLAMRPSRRGA